MLRLVSVATLLFVATAASAQPMSQYVAQSVLQVCPTAASPEQCVVDFAPVITEAKAVDALESAFRRRYPDPKFGSLDVMQANLKATRLWTQVTSKHDQRWSR